MKHKEKIKEFNQRFKRVFKIDMEKYWHVLMGFNLIDFDLYLMKKYADYEQGGKSMNDCILENYGKKGIELLDELMDYCPLIEFEKKCLNNFKKAIAIYPCSGYNY